MLIDARTLSAGQTIETDVCIVGAGPAGIALAQEFLGKNLRVCLLESGGLEEDDATQSLAAGKVIGDPFEPLQESRQRQFGGTANSWGIRIAPRQIGVRYMPLAEVDFEQRSWVPYSGWPLTKADLDPFYERAQVVCQAGPYAYEPEPWESTEAIQLPFIGNRVTTTMFQFGPRTVFTHEYREQLRQSPTITTYLYANAVELETNETAQTVTRLRVACLQGHEFWVAAKVFVLASGGLENARLLLLSDQTQTAGLGNQHDLVGRFFMDHPLVIGGLFIPANCRIFNSTALYDLRQVNHTSVMGHLTLTRQAMIQEQLLNISAMLFPRHTQYGSDAFQSLVALVSPLRRGKLPKAVPQHLGTVLSGLNDLALRAYLQARNLEPPYSHQGWGGWSLYSQKDKRFDAFEVIHITEQLPDPDNRVVLSCERDPLGRFKTELHWRWRDADIQQVQRAQAVLAQEIARAGFGRFQIDRDGERPKLYSPCAHHHIGTTRMHVDPKQGVVDANSRVHGVSNLFIAGSSVFPTGGYANPTLTVVALAIRLADHLKQVVTQPALTGASVTEPSITVQPW